MAKKKLQGICCMCGKFADLSEEHVPPQKAFNDTTVIEYYHDDVLTHRRSKGRSKYKQGGASGYTLCKPCNNNTGSWYSVEYIKWARTWTDGLALVRRTDKMTLTLGLLSVSPLRFLKQVVVMMLSVNGQGTNGNYLKNNFDLSQFVLDKTSQSLPANYRFWLCLYPPATGSETALRRGAVTGRLPIEHSENGVRLISDTVIYSEIAHPPFDVIMTSKGEPFLGATEFTQFATYPYDFRGKIELTLPVVSNPDFFAGGYSPS